MYQIIYWMTLSPYLILGSGQQEVFLIDPVSAVDRWVDQTVSVRLISIAGSVIYSPDTRSR